MRKASQELGTSMADYGRMGEIGPDLRRSVDEFGDQILANHTPNLDPFFSSPLRLGVIGKRDEIGVCLRDVNATANHLWAPPPP